MELIHIQLENTDIFFIYNAMKNAEAIDLIWFRLIYI